MERDIQSNVMAFHRRLRHDANHRYRSWEHCYSYFNRRGPVNPDISCLHLAFYLASWGMYRGSSFLLWKDYRIHSEVVKRIRDRKYASLWTMNYGNIKKSGRELVLLFDLIKWTRDWYFNNIKTINGETREATASDTLITKILLGTIGCVPAYDRFFISGMRHKGLSFSSLNMTNYWPLIEFYKQNQKGFDSARSTISATIKYPAMKVVDMYFWNIGLTLSPEEEKDAT